MTCLLRTTVGELRVIADYADVCAFLRDPGTGDWLEVQEQNDVQTRHLIRRSSILMITEVPDGQRRTVSARILDVR